MNSESTLHVSVIDPIDPAIKRVKEILFRPFDLGRWFVIGFCAWLATLAEGGGFNFRVPSEFGERGGGGLDEFKEFINEHLGMIVVGGAVALLVFVGITLLLVWLSSRGRFMFLYCVSQNKAEVKNPWHIFRRHANSLFLFRLVVGLIGMVVVLAVAAGIGVLFYFAAQNAPARVMMFLIGGLTTAFILLPLAIVFALIAKFTKDFVVPVMYIHNCTCVNGWKYFLSILSANKGRFVLYILFQIVIGMAVGAIVMALACVTLGCACCFMAIPYIGTVLLLPLLTFQRAYSLMYLRQYGAGFDVFSQAQPQAQPAPQPPSMPAQDQWQP